jgi:hypothetical protein
MQRLEIDLNNPHFYIDKIHSGIMRKEEEVYRQPDQSRPVPNPTTTNPDRPHAQQPGDGASMTLSRITGPTGPFKSTSDRTEPSNETIDSLIANKLKNQMKTSLKHSEAANKLVFTKFKLDPKEFQNFHRFVFPFDKLKDRLTVQIVKNKGIKQHADYL